MDGDRWGSRAELGIASVYLCQSPFFWYFLRDLPWSSHLLSVLRVIRFQFLECLSLTLLKGNFFFYPWYRFEFNVGQATYDINQTVHKKDNCVVSTALRPPLMCLADTSRYIHPLRMDRDCIRRPVVNKQTTLRWTAYVHSIYCTLDVDRSARKIRINSTVQTLTVNVFLLNKCIHKECILHLKTSKQFTYDRWQSKSGHDGIAAGTLAAYSAGANSGRHRGACGV